ncbi:MAG: hypothetical protein Q8R36_03125 [bacterium]|nr:hypothetical protein [bacterium]
MRIGGEQNFFPDHDAIAVGKGNGRAVCALLQHFFDFEPNYTPELIGDEETKMWTADMRRDHVQIAVMEGVDGFNKEGELVRSQISFYEDGRGHGPMTVQHKAIGCRDVSDLADGLFSKGIRFLTEHENGQPKILVGTDNVAGKVLQVFTYPIINGIFLEFKQKVGGREAETFKEFRDDNVRGLWWHVRRMIEKMGEEQYFKLNIFGETCSLSESLLKRGVSRFMGVHILEKHS